MGNTKPPQAQVSRDVDLEVNTDKSNYIAMSRHKTTEKNQNLLFDNKSFENY
jgi:hypothetical protein